MMFLVWWDSLNRLAALRSTLAYVARTKKAMMLPELARLLAVSCSRVGFRLLEESNPSFEVIISQYPSLSTDMCFDMPKRRIGI